MKKSILAILATLATTVAQAEFTGYKPEELKSMQVEDIQSKFDLTPEEAKMTYDLWQKLPYNIPFTRPATQSPSTDKIKYEFYIQRVKDRKIQYDVTYGALSLMYDGTESYVSRVDPKYMLMKTKVVCEGPYGTYITNVADSKEYQKPIAFDPVCVFYNTDYYISSYNEGDESKKEKRAEELRHMSQLDYVSLVDQGRLTEQDIFNALYNFPNMPTSLKEGDHIGMLEMTGKDYNGEPITKPVRYTLLDANNRKWKLMENGVQQEFECIEDSTNVYAWPTRHHLCVFYNELQKASL